MAMHNELWFPSVIWSAVIHTVKNSDVKNFAYYLQRTEPSRQASNFGGYQSRDITKGECEGIDKLVQTVDKELETICLQVGLKPVQLYNLWININSPGCYNEIHHHKDAIFSGVYYVDAQPEQGNIMFDRGDNAEYHVNPDMVDKVTYFTSSRAPYVSKTNALYIFPAWLKHSVQGNTSNTDRISISFNYGEPK